ncbi:cell elongation-specific peptidoglycan biosynthesis regulator RodA [Arboricoccus pini]|uniref:Peptidoglycan glycosyltransferase MrdB n=1 Tax=Arboricoccus pini TaxID=1963835 RepID=A0A212QQ60_9PROT|nr:rod shape-determining protein RodA [Arboricoccus pini]SNB61411.1 cell elongation-specific peptidoglycan biosynthesis regulator RodA [Arboricoccus pini]
MIRPPLPSLGARFSGLHWPLIGLIVLMGLVGYGVLYSAAGGSNDPWAWRHAMRLGVGVVIMLMIAVTDIRWLFNLAFPFYAIVLALLLGVDVMGEISKGAQRWIDLGIIQIQPSELMKLALIMALARWFHGRRIEDVRRPLVLIAPLLMIAAPVVLVLLQPDLGTAAMLAGAGTALLFLAGVPIWQFLLVGAAGAAALPILWSRLHDYQRQRVLTFLNPEEDPLGTGYHIIQSKIALGSGGFWGKGYLNGSQAQLNFLPEKQTDFAFTMMGEEVGFVGCVVVLSLFLLMLFLTLRIAIRSQSQFGRLVAMGMGCNLALYVSINVAMVTGLVPVVGIPLPMVSYGGTAMLTVLMGFGLTLAVDAQRETIIPRFPGHL